MSWIGDLRLSTRALIGSPGFTAAAVGMLALGIGINATVFTVVDAVLFKGFPLVQGNDRLLYISNGGCCISYPDFEDIRAQSKSFQAMGVTHGISKVIGDDAAFPERIDVTEVTAGTFGAVGVRPVLGRDFAPSDEIAGAAPVAILSHGFWQRRYGRDLSIVGRTVRMNGAPTTIVGVMPEGFSFPQTVDLWVPLVKTAQVLNRNNTDTWFAFGRLAEGVSFQSARVEVEGIIRRLETAYPLTDRRLHLVVQNFAGFFIGANAVELYGSMWGAVGFVLLIACANLANLLLARSAGRSREISVRIALGASRWHVVRQLLIESLLLSSAGGLLGWWLAKWGVHAFQAAMAQKSSWLILDYTMDGRVAAYLIAISLASAILFGLVPALRVSKLDVNTALKDGGRGALGAVRAKHLSSILVAGEMALAVVLLAGAGVMIRSFLKIHTANMGVNPENVLVASVDLTSSRYPTPEARISFFDRLSDAAAALPGVESVALAETLPSWNAHRIPYEPDGAESPNDRDQRPKVLAMTIGPGYFRTVGAALLAGRDFSGSDTPASGPVAIVNQALAARFWQGQEPLGKRIRLFEDGSHGRWVSVIGVASNIVQNDDSRQRFEPLIYLPYRQNPGNWSWILVQTRTPPGGLAGAFRRQLQAIDPDLPLYGPFLMTDRLERFWDNRFYGSLFLIFASLALLLAAIGLYSVIAHAVAHRTAEIGVRVALGATATDILHLVLTQGMLPLAIGLGAGLAGSLAVNQVLRSALVQVSPSDPLTLVTASAVLILAAASGCWIPARRAMRVDPLVALRHE